MGASLEIDPDQSSLKRQRIFGVTSDRIASGFVAMYDRDLIVADEKYPTTKQGLDSRPSYCARIKSEQIDVSDGLDELRSMSLADHGPSSCDGRLREKN